MALGATSFEAVLPSIRNSLLTALTPHLNMLSVVGLVAIPGMMVGQLLGGSSPAIAAEYQLAILWLNTTVVGFGTLVAVFLACHNAVFDARTHRLTLERIFEKKKMDVFSAITFHVKRACCMRYESKPKDLPSFGTNLREPLTDADDSNNNQALCGDYSLVINDDSVHSPASTSSYVPKRRKGKATYTIHEAEGTGDVNNNIHVAKKICILKIKNLNVQSGEELLFLNDEGMCLDIFEGDRIAICGPSGLGKTRLLRCLSKLEEPTKGHVNIYFGGVLNENAMKDNSIWRSYVIYVPQALPPLEGHPFKLIQETLQFRSKKRLHSESISPELVADIATETEISLGLAEGKMQEPWSSLSGGERQRSAIAVAITVASVLTCNSKLSAMKDSPGSIVLLLDEPTGACDLQTTMNVENTLISLGFTVIMVSHDVDQQQRFSTRRIILTEQQSDTSRGDMD